MKKLIACAVMALFLCGSAGAAWSFNAGFIGTCGGGGGSGPQGAEPGDMRFSEGLPVIEATDTRHELWPAGVPGVYGWHLDSDSPVFYVPVFDAASTLWSFGGVALHDSHYWGQGVPN